MSAFRIRFYGVRKSEVRFRNDRGWQPPVVHCAVDGHLVKFDGNRGWHCKYPGCDDIDTCPHVDAVLAMLGPGPWDEFDGASA